MTAVLTPRERKLKRRYRKLALFVEGRGFFANLKDEQGRSVRAYVIPLTGEQERELVESHAISGGTR